MQIQEGKSKMTENKLEITKIQLQKATELPPENKYYFNGFTVQITPADFTIVLLLDNEPIAYLNSTHTLAKTLSTKIEGLIKNFEEKTKTTIMTLDELSSALEGEDDSNDSEE